MAYGEAVNSFSELSKLNGTDLLARMIYSEARGESDKGRIGCAFLVKNRKDKYTTEFGGNTWAGVILKSGQFDGMKTDAALCPDTSSTAWKECLELALNVYDEVNPIGTCLWFNGNSYYEGRCRTSGDKEYYSFDSGSEREVVEKVVIGNHTFFRVSGY